MNTLKLPFISRTLRLLTVFALTGTLVPAPALRADPLDTFSSTRDRAVALYRWSCVAAATEDVYADVAAETTRGAVAR